MDEMHIAKNGCAMCIERCWMLNREKKNDKSNKNKNCKV